MLEDLLYMGRTSKGNVFNQDNILAQSGSNSKKSGSSGAKVATPSLNSMGSQSRLTQVEGNMIDPQVCIVYECPEGSGNFYSEQNISNVSSGHNNVK